MRGRKLLFKLRARLFYGEEIDNPRMRGRKPSLTGGIMSSNTEEIDNPRMRGRKLFNSSSSAALAFEEIDNPRMRGRKPLIQRVGSLQMGRN